MSFIKRFLSERFKGFFYKSTPQAGDTKFAIGDHSWREICAHHDQTFNEHSLAKSQTLTIAGQLLASDVFLEAKQRNGEPYPRAEEAQSKCEDLNYEIGLNLIIFDTAVNLVRYGSSFVEKTFTPTFYARIMPQIEYIEPHMQNDVGDITAWRLRDNLYSQDYPIFRVPDEIAEFHFNRTTTSWPYGTSMYVGLDTEFAILAQLEQDIQAHMHKTAHPKEVVGIGDRDYAPSATDAETIRRQFRQWEPGQTMVTNYPVQGISMGVANREIGNLGEVLDFVKDQATDGLMMPPISRQYSSTNASSKEMTDWAQANLIIPLRRLIGRVIEREIYQPYLMSMGFSVRTTPKILWEPPDMNREEDALYFSQLVTAGVMPPIVAARELGFEDEFVKWDKEQKAEREEMMQFQKIQGQGQQQPNAKEWFVREMG